MKQYLTPARRKAMHALTTGVIIVAGTFGWLTGQQAAIWTGLAIGVIDVVIAVIVAQGVRQAIYALTAAASVALVGYGIMTQEQAASIVALIPLAFGAFLAEGNTDPSTESGQPANELAA